MWTSSAARSSRATRKGARDRATLLPAAVATPLVAHLGRVQAQHEQDLREGLGSVELPLALERKYPRAELAVGLPGHPALH